MIDVGSMRHEALLTDAKRLLKLFNLPTGLMSIERKTCANIAVDLAMSQCLDIYKINNWDWEKSAKKENLEYIKKLIDEQV